MLPCSFRLAHTQGLFLTTLSPRIQRQMADQVTCRFIVFYSWISSSFPRPPAKRAVALAAINAFSQLGNVAGSYVWDLSANGYRKSYGIVTAMFGFTIFACYLFKMMLNQLNQKLERGELDWDAREDVANQTAEMEGTTVDEALSMRVSHRFSTQSDSILHSRISSTFPRLALRLILICRYRRDSAIWCRRKDLRRTKTERFSSTSKGDAR